MPFRRLEIVPVDPKVDEHLGKQALANLLLAVFHGHPSMTCVESDVRSSAFGCHEPNLKTPALRPSADPRDELPPVHVRHGADRRQCLSRIDAHIFERNTPFPKVA